MTKIIPIYRGRHPERRKIVGWLQVYWVPSIGRWVTIPERDQ